MAGLLMLALLCGGGTEGQKQRDAADLIQKLHETKLWDPYDAGMRGQLGRYLEVVEKSRDPEVLRYLADQHLDYELDLRASQGSTRRTYPVVGLFARLGLTHVPLLLRAIKEIDPKETPTRADHHREFLVLTISEIYRERAAGEDCRMALERIRLEIGKSRGPERESLEKCLPRPSGELPAAAAHQP